MGQTGITSSWSVGYSSPLVLKGYHLHLFDVGGILFGAPNEDANYVISEKAAKLMHLMPRLGASLRWDYDFGDGWVG